MAKRALVLGRIFVLPTIFAGWLGMLGFAMFSVDSFWLGVFLAALFALLGMVGGVAVSLRWFY